MSLFKSMAVLGLLTVASSATAATVTARFDGERLDFETLPYTENGLNFRVLADHYDIFEGEFQIDFGFEAPIIEITFDGGFFDLVSFDVTRAPNAPDIVFTSDRGDSYAVPTAPDRDPIFSPTVSPTMFKSVFPTTFKGVSTITLSGGGSTFQFDNFTIDDRATDGVGTPSPVPLPAAFPLLGVALGGLGFAARRRKASRI